MTILVYNLLTYKTPYLLKIIQKVYTETNQLVSMQNIVLLIDLLQIQKLLPIFCPESRSTFPKPTSLSSYFGNLLIYK